LVEGVTVGGGRVGSWVKLLGCIRAAVARKDEVALLEKG
jgi:hypothetical protein